jgi:hypothetical protein
LWVLSLGALASHALLRPRSKLALRLVTVPVSMVDLQEWHFNRLAEAADLGTPSYFVSWANPFFTLPTLRWDKRADKNDLHCPGPVF